MDINITINIPQLDALIGAAKSAIPAADPKPAPTRARSDAKAAGTASEDKPATAPETKADAASGSDEDIALRTKQAAAAFSQKNGRDALVQLLKDHGASAGVSTIPEDKREAFISAASAE